MYLEYFYILIFVFVFLILSEFIGRLLMRSICRTDKAGLSGLFLSLTFGFTGVLSIYSIINTNGKTINLGILIILLFLFFSNRNKNNSKKPNYIKNYNGIIIPTLVLFSVLAIVNFHHLPSVSIDNDIRFYTKVAESLTTYGIENTYHHYNIHNQFSTTTSPNHYFELWVGSLFLKLFPWQESLIVFKYAMYFALRFWVLLGMLAVIECFVKKISLLHIFYVVAFSLIAWNLPLGIFSSGGWESAMYSSMWLRPNFIIYFAYIIATLIFFIQKEYDTGLRLLIILPIISIVTAPAILSSAFIFCIYSWLVLKQKKYAKLLLEVLSVAVFIALFYLATTAGESSIPIFEKENLISKTVSLIKPIVFYIVMLTIRCSFLIVVLLLLASQLKSKFWRKDNSLLQFSFLCFLLTFTGIVLFQVIAYVDNAYQFAYVGYVSIAILAFLASTYVIFGSSYEQSYLYKTTQAITIFSLIALFTWSLYSYKAQFNLSITQDSIAKRDLQHYGFSEEYIDNLHDFFQQNDNAQGAFAISRSALNKYNPKRRHTLTYQIDSHIAYFLSNQTSRSVIKPEIMYMEETKLSESTFTKAHSFNDRLPFYRNYEDKSNYVSNFILSEGISFIISDIDYQLPDGISSKKEFADTKQGIIFREIEFSK